MQDDDEVPLEREEEAAWGSARPDGSGRDRSVDLLFRTRLRSLNLRPPIAVAPSDPASVACEKMRAHRIGCVLVLAGSRLAGIFTERDVLYKLAAAGVDPKSVTMEQVMTPDPTTLRGGHRLAHALNKMVADGCRHIPVVDEAGRPLGVVSVRRIADFLVEAFPDALLNLPPDPDLSPGSAEGG